MYYWEKSYRDFKLKESEKKDYVEKGVQAVDHSPPDQTGLHGGAGLQEPAAPPPGELQKDPSKQQALIKQADQLRDKAQEIRKQKTAGVSNRGLYSLK